MSASRGLRRLPRKCAVTTTLHPLRRTPNQITTVLSASQHSQALTYIPFRSYSTPAPRSEPVPSRNDDYAAIEDGNLALEEEMLAMQDEAIAELEKRLGKSLQQAIEEDNLAEIVLENDQYAEDASGENVILIESTDSPLVQLRARGSPSDDVAREARNIFGEYLPEDALSQEELTVYKRLYGEPLPEPEVDVDGERLIAESDNVDVSQVPKNILLDAAGAQIDYHLENETEIADSIQGRVAASAAEGEAVLPDAKSRSGLNRKEELEEIATMLDGNLVDEDFDFDQDEEASEYEDLRSHPLTSLGRFATNPSTTFLPRETFVRPVEQVMSNFSNKQLKELCERKFGGLGMPDSPLTPRSARSRQQLPTPLEARQSLMGQMEANAFLTVVMPPVYASVLAILSETRRRLGATWLNRLLARKGGPRILDAGSGGAGILAWRDIVNAHWEALHSSDKNFPPAPPSKAVVLTGSDALRHRAAAMLDNTTFVPRLPDYVHVRDAPTMHDQRPVQRKQFDVIIASHSLFPMKEEWERRQYVQNLWSLLSDEGGVLIMIEKGIPRGFEAVAAARDLLLERYIKVPEGEQTSYSNTSGLESLEQEVYQKSPGMIIAPCTNHDRCPLYTTNGVSKGRKDVCSFQQRYIRPPFLQRILGAKDRNHDDVDYSYISIMKGDDLRNRSFTKLEHIEDPIAAPSTRNALRSHNVAASNIQKGFENFDPTESDSPAPPPPHALPRILSHPLKRKGHVTIDLCTPQAEIRRWTIPKSFSRQAYHDARKAKWGDLWALGAKTNIARNLKTGTSQKELAKSEGFRGGPGKAKARREAREMDMQDGVLAHERGNGTRIEQGRNQSRTAEKKEEERFMMMLKEDNLIDEADDEDDGLIDMDTLLPKRSVKREAAAKAERRNDKSSVDRRRNAADGVVASPRAGTLGSNSSADVRRSISSSRAAAVASKKADQEVRAEISRSIDPSQPPAPQRQQSARSEATHDNLPVMQPIRPSKNRRASPEDEDNFSEWSQELNKVMLEDEARRGVQQSGRRPTAKNTQRFKRDLRRERRKNQEQDL